MVKLEMKGDLSRITIKRHNMRSQKIVVKTADLEDIAVEINRRIHDTLGGYAGKLEHLNVIFD